MLKQLVHVTTLASVLAMMGAPAGAAPRDAAVRPVVPPVKRRVVVMPEGRLAVALAA